MSSDWNPELYRQFEDERTRPARELLARVALQDPKRVFDLGCGPGNSTELLVERFSSAEIIGTDNSERMLVEARARLPKCRFELSDITRWQPSQAPDLIYANAALQWVESHDELIPRLFDSLAPNGVLAIQMPDNREEPTHRLMRELASLAPWSGLIASAASVRTKILPLYGYYDLLAPHAAEVDVWRTAYQHPMASPAKIVEWVSSTGLRPFTDPLPEAERASYLAEYERLIAQAYLPRADGRLLLAFPRMFIVARRKP